LYGIYGVFVTYPLIFLSVYVYKFGGIIATALIYAASAFSIGIAPIFISPLSDKTGFRIKYSNIFILLGSLLMLLSISLKDFVLPILIIASALLQVGQPLFISYETERNKNVGSSVGKFYIFINLGYLFGSLLFGLIISYFGFESTTIIFSLAGIVISIVFLRVKEERIYVKNPKKNEYYQGII
jgi:Major Facilitator Superfamily.